MSSGTEKGGGSSPLVRRAVLAGAGLSALGGLGYLLAQQPRPEQATGISSTVGSTASLAPGDSGQGHPASSPSASAVPHTPGATAPGPLETPGGGLPTKESVVAQYTGRTPAYWGEHAPGVYSRFTPARGEKQVALTFDACGGSALGYDSQLISLLRHHRVKATLFINMRWAQAHPDLVRELADDPLFEIANHGKAHVPLSAAPRMAWGIPSTQSVGEIWSEIADNTLYLRQQGISPAFMRPGTAFSDEIGSAVAAQLGTPLVSYSVNGDGGATYPAPDVAASVGRAAPGDIVISHFNRPLSGTAAGYAAALPELKHRGFSFVQLSDVLKQV